MLNYSDHSDEILVDVHLDAVNIMLGLIRNRPGSAISLLSLVDLIQERFDNRAKISIFFYGPELDEQNERKTNRYFRNFYAMFRRAGAVMVLKKPEQIHYISYDEITGERKMAKGKKKCDCDSEIIPEIMDRALNGDAEAIILMSGDGDFIRMLEKLSSPRSSIPFEIFAIKQSMSSAMKRRFGERTATNPEGKITYIVPG